MVPLSQPNTEHSRTRTEAFGKRLKLMSTVTLTPAKARKLRIFERDGWTCWYCGINVEPFPANDCYPTKHTATLDHIHPKFWGGDNSDSNLTTACFSCNARKRDKTVEEYRQQLRYSNEIGKSIALLRAAQTPLIDSRHIDSIETIIADLEKQLPEIKFFGETKEASLSWQ